MTADGFLQQKQRHPVAMAAAIAINVAGLTAVMLAKSGYIVIDHGTIQTYPVPMPSPPPENVDPPKPHERVPVDHPVFTPKRTAENNTDKGPDIATTRDPGEIFPNYPPLGDGPKIEPKQPDPPAPVIVGAQPDPAFAGAFQPPYPPQLLRTGVEGKVVVKVLIGADGRVKQAVIVSADDPKFADVTERQALGRWRFRPATRDGVPVESWKQLTVRFEIRA
jgi:protein TonB